MGEKKKRNEVRRNDIFFVTFQAFCSDGDRVDSDKKEKKGTTRKVQRVCGRNMNYFKGAISYAKFFICCAPIFLCTNFLFLFIFSFLILFRFLFTLLKEKCNKQRIVVVIQHYKTKMKFKSHFIPLAHLFQITITKTMFQKR